MPTEQVTISPAPQSTQTHIRDIVMAQRDHEREIDEAVRSEPLLRTAIVEIVGELNVIIKKHAAIVASLNGMGKTGTFAEEEISDLLTFKLAEFLVQANLEHSNMNEPQILRGWQMTPAHAADWESIQIMPDGSFVVMEMYS